MNNLLNQSRLFLKRNGSTILTCIGGVGVIATSIMAVKATPKALRLLEEAKQEKEEKLTKLEVVKVAGPAYIPATIMGVATIASIFGANMLNTRHQASMASAYALLNESYKEYKAKVVELYGEEVDLKIKKEIAKDKYEEGKVTVEESKELFFDDFSGRYFQSTLYDVQQAEYRLNRELIMRDYVNLNEFYEWLGIPPIDAGYELGWSKGANFATYWQEWVDFTHSKVEMEDGMECHIIQMLGEPVPDFEEYW